jgi:hypothetical protein
MYSHQDIRCMDQYLITEQQEYEVGILITHCRVVLKARATSFPTKILFRFTYSYVNFLDEGVLF